jgi:hypothetical protein
MCHCECSIKIHVKMCERSVRNLLRIWNALSLSISYNWQVALAYLMLILFFINSNYWIWIFFISFVWLYIIYNGLALYSNSTPMYYSNTMSNFLSQHSTCIFSIRLFLDNAYRILIPQAFFKLVLPNILFNMNVLKIISH